MNAAIAKAANEASDEQLLVCYRDTRDPRAFEVLVHRYEKPIYNYLLRYLRNSKLAEEVFQIAFFKLHERCDRFTEGRRLRPWLYSIATHAAVDVLRREGRHKAVSLNEHHMVNDADAGALLGLLGSASPTPVEVLEERERRDWTRQAVDGLPEPLREVILMIFFQGLKYREVAETLALPTGTVKSRVHKALVTLNAAWKRDHVREEN